MSGLIPQYTLIATKVGNAALSPANAVQLLVVSPSGSIKFALTIANGDFTSINTTVNGGAVGTSLSFAYPVSAYPAANSAVSSVADYPNGYIASENP